MDPQACHRIKVDRFDSPLWMVSGAWDGDSILWIDAARGEIQRVAANGEIELADVPTHQALVAAQPRLQGPSYIWNRPTGFQVEYKAPAQIFNLGAQLEEVSAFNVEQSANKAAGVSVLATYGIAPFASGGFLSFADIIEASAPNPPNSAFVHMQASGDLQVYGDIPVGNESKNQDKISVNARVRDQYTRYYMPYLTTIKDDGFILFLNEKPTLAKVGTDGSLTHLPKFPEEFQHRPVLSRNRELRFDYPEQELEFYQQLESSNLAAGLYSWGDELFLLGKKTKGSQPARADWWMVNINPVTGEQEYKKRLPTHAPHLTVIPGPRFVALVEKGHVRPITDSQAPYTPIREMLLVPTPWFEEGVARMAECHEAVSR